MAPDRLDAEIIDFFKETSPSGAFLVGFNDYAGKLFISSEANIASALRRVRGLKKRAKTDLQRKVLGSMEMVLELDEPQPILEDIVGTIFVHLVKDKGVNDEHMASLLDDAMKTVDASVKRFSKRKVPVAVKALALYRLDGIIEILDTVKKETKSARVRAACDALKVKATSYVKLFDLPGFGKGEFSNVEKLFKEHGFDLGRQKIYPEVLRRAYDYPETPDQLEKNATAWLEEELPRFRSATEKLSKKFGLEPVPEEIEKGINQRMKLDPKKLVKTTLDIRRVVQRMVNEDVHGINPKYDTKVIETPSYLSGAIPTGAAQFFDTYTKKPFQVFFQTTDPKRDPDKSVAAILNLLIHEEYGHCVHHSNSAVGFVGKLNPVQLLPGAATGAPITEGLSFNRELEFLEVSRGLETKKSLTPAERAYVKMMESYGGLKQVNLELEFMTRRWRVVRFLRVIGDVWINTGKKGLIEFVDWAHKKTGVPRSSVYFQLFPAHEGLGPGYATCYAVVGQEIRAMERKIKDPKDRVKFSTYLCSIGFPPRSLYKQMLVKYAASLR